MVIADFETAQQTQETDRSAVCQSCDGFCPVTVKVKDDRVVKVTPRQTPLLKDVICMKGVYAPKSLAHPNRFMHPLKRVGARGDGQWEQVTWERALDDIAEQMAETVKKYGPEAVAISMSGANIGTDNGLARRFFNHLGSPNYISGVAYCFGNTAAVNRMVYGWFPQGDILNSKCIVLWGHDPRRHSWTMEYKAIRMAQARGAKLIVLDPRRSGNADSADIWLPLRAGSDTAMAFGWLNVIIEEQLYDEDFVRDWTIGFDALAERVREFPLQRVSEITGVDAELIAKAARLYATSKSATIPWTPITDQQNSSTSAIRLHCTLRSLTGNLDVKGGDNFVGFNPAVRSDTEIEMHDILPDKQKAKQLGSDKYPVFTYRGQEPLKEPTERVWGHRWANIARGTYMANPMALFKAMAEEDPYPVKTFFSIANNTLMAYANTRRIYDAMMNQDLIVSYEHMPTPTTQISDYILPGDSWLERPSMDAGISEKSMDPPGECRSVVYLWTELAKRMGFGNAFPWESVEQLLDYRLEPSETTWEQVVTSGVGVTLNRGQKQDDQERKYLKSGFATPSGKVELYSSILKDLGFDPLPYYREIPALSAEFPLQMFTGLPDDEFYRTGHRHVPELRRRANDPTLYMNESDAAALGIQQGAWARVSTSLGSMLGRLDIRPSMPTGLVRVPHGWWKPESTPGLKTLSGMWDFTDAQLTPDEDPEFVDREQGIPHMKGLPCNVTKLSEDEVQRLEAEYGPTTDLPVGPEGKRTENKSDPTDFMYDDDMGYDVEFEAVELSMYGRLTL